MDNTLENMIEISEKYLRNDTRPRSAQEATIQDPRRPEREHSIQYR
jgi:hypothetical protein